MHCGEVEELARKTERQRPHRWALFTQGAKQDRLPRSGRGAGRQGPAPRFRTARAPQVQLPAAHGHAKANDPASRGSFDSPEDFEAVCGRGCEQARPFSEGLHTGLSI